MIFSILCSGSQLVYIVVQTKWKNFVTHNGISGTMDRQLYYHRGSAATAENFWVLFLFCLLVDDAWHMAVSF